MSNPRVKNIVRLTLITLLIYCSCTARRVSRVKNVDLNTSKGRVHSAREWDDNCTMIRETASHNGRRGSVVRDFQSGLKVLVNSSKDGVCYVRFMTNEEKTNPCSGVNNSTRTETPSREKKVHYQVVGDFDVNLLPPDIAQENNCKSAKLLRPLNHELDHSNRPRRDTITIEVYEVYLCDDGGCDLIGVIIIIS